MSGDSEAMSGCTLSVHIGLDDDQASQSRVEYLSDGSSISKRESVFDPSLEVASPSRKSANGPSICPKTCKVVAEAPRHGIGKGLMTSQGLVAPPPLPLLVNDKEYVMDTTCSIIRDADLDKCLEHKTDPLGEFSLFDMMRACSISITFIPF
nr:hypothetical protein CFP56_51614 [Quercus suber]